MTTSQTTTARQDTTPTVRAVEQDELRLAGGGAADHKKWIPLEPVGGMTRKPGGG